MAGFKEEAARKPFGLFGAWIVSLFLVTGFIGVQTAKAVPEKEWTMLLFLNGHNNLDRFGAFNLNQMEKVGSSDQVNMVVQWASTAARNVKRVYVERDTDTNRVTSPVVEELGIVDMGNVEVLNQFVRWGVDHYPAKKYFIAVWNHGSGWRLQALNSKNGGESDLTAQDISYDDFSGNHITTQQLGQAMREAARVIGHKVDLYGSDACLMAMAEVADEMADSVTAFVGSQELEPGEGWPYDLFSARWVARPTVSGQDLGRILTEEYLRYYQRPGSRSQVTFSAYDLTDWARFRTALDRMGTSLSAMDASAKQAFLRISPQAQRFDSSDFADLSDLLRVVKAAAPSSIEDTVLDDLNTQLNSVIIANGTTATYSKAKGMSIWLPNTASIYNRYRTKYQTLRMGQSAWGNALQSLFH